MATTFFAIAAVATCTTFTALAVVSLYRATSRRRERRAPRLGMPHVTVLKPLCGADDALEANLETFFAQTYPRFELLFGVEGKDDPAAAVVRRLRARYPNVPCRLVIHDGGRALNPKVSNLRAMLEAGTHDVLLISDSNIAVDAGYLSRMVGQLVSGSERVGVVTSLIAGVGEQSWGAALDNLHLNGYAAGAVAVTQEVGDRCAVIGKSMMFRRSVLERLGGFESVSTVLAEDWVIGRMFQEAGYRVALCPHPVRNVQVKTPVRGFLRRQVRWGLLRSRLIPMTYALEPLSNPMAVGVAAAWALGAAWPLAWGVALVLGRDAAGWLRVRGRKGLMTTLPLGPFKDLTMLGVWLVAPFLKQIKWRRTTVRIGSGTRLFADREQDAPALLECED